MIIYTLLKPFKIATLQSYKNVFYKFDNVCKKIKIGIFKIQNENSDSHTMFMKTALMMENPT